MTITGLGGRKVVVTVIGILASVAGVVLKAPTEFYVAVGGMVGAFNGSNAFEWKYTKGA